MKTLFKICEIVFLKLFFILCLSYTGYSETPPTSHAQLVNQLANIVGQVTANPEKATAIFGIQEGNRQKFLSVLQVLTDEVRKDPVNGEGKANRFFNTIINPPAGSTPESILTGFLTNTDPRTGVFTSANAEQKQVLTDNLGLILKLPPAQFAPVFSKINQQIKDQLAGTPSNPGTGAGAANTTPNPVVDPKVKEAQDKAKKAIEDKEKAEALLNPNNPASPLNPVNNPNSPFNQNKNSGNGQGGGSGSGGGGGSGGGAGGGSGGSTGNISPPQNLTNLNDVQDKVHPNKNSGQERGFNQTRDLLPSSNNSGNSLSINKDKDGEKKDAFKLPEAKTNKLADSKKPNKTDADGKGADPSDLNLDPSSANTNLGLTPGTIKLSDKTSVPSLIQREDAFGGLGLGGAAGSGGGGDSGLGNSTLAKAPGDGSAGGGSLQTDGGLTPQQNTDPVLRKFGILTNDSNAESESDSGGENNSNDSSYKSKSKRGSILSEIIDLTPDEEEKMKGLGIMYKVGKSAKEACKKEGICIGNQRKSFFLNKQLAEPTL